jgi:hypothetical protein
LQVAPPNAEPGLEWDPEVHRLVEIWWLEDVLKDAFEVQHVRQSQCTHGHVTTARGSHLPVLMYYVARSSCQPKIFSQETYEIYNKLFQEKVPQDLPYPLPIVKLLLLSLLSI